MKRRLIRVAIPCAAAAALVAVTVVAHLQQTPDVTDPAFLNPASAAPIGASQLADRLRAAGVQIQTVSSSQSAFLAASTGPVTLFIPTPALVDPDLLRRLDVLPGGTRVVLVAPGEATLFRADLPVAGAVSRWAPERADPGAGCGLPEAIRAGPAGIYGLSYGDALGEVAFCYAGALVAFADQPAPSPGRPEVTVLLAGASDPFRNDRIAEYGNAVLATGLLQAYPRVVWLDLHRQEHAAKTTPTAVPVPADGGPPTEAGRRPTVADLFPPWVWAAVGLLALAGVALAVAAARRLGGVVTEPMPVAAWSSETVTGRGRLYHRSGDRAAALSALRESAQAALAAELAVAAPHPPDVLVAAVTTVTGLPPDGVRSTLYGDPSDPRLEDDQQLRHAVEQLDALVVAARRSPPPVP